MPLWSVARFNCDFVALGLFFGRHQISLMQNCGVVQPMFRGELFLEGHKSAPISWTLLQEHPSQIYEALLEGLGSL